MLTSFTTEHVHKRMHNLMCEHSTQMNLPLHGDPSLHRHKGGQTADESDWIETANLLETIHNTHTQSRWLHTEFQPIGQTGAGVVGVASDVELLNLMARTSGLMSASKRYFMANHLPRNWGGGGRLSGGSCGL